MVFLESARSGSRHGASVKAANVQTLVIHEQQSWPDDLALASLRHAAAAFVELDTTPTSTICRSRSSARSTHSAARLNSARSPGSTSGKSSRTSVTPAAFTPDPFHRAGAKWPRGYPGDFETIEYLCAAENRSLPQTVQHALEELALRSSISGQHRNKVAFQAKAILAACRRTNGRGRILSIGCGGCRDIR